MYLNSLFSGDTQIENCFRSNSVCKIIGTQSNFVCKKFGHHVKNQTMNDDASA